MHLNSKCILGLHVSCPSYHFVKKVLSTGLKFNIPSLQNGLVLQRITLPIPTQVLENNLLYQDLPIFQGTSWCSLGIKELRV